MVHIIWDVYWQLNHFLGYTCTVLFTIECICSFYGHINDSWCNDFIRKTKLFTRKRIPFEFAAALTPQFEVQMH